MKVVVFTLGCKVNEVESASMMTAFESMGLEVCDSLCPADIYVLNTCAVTKEAEKKSRQLIARAKKFNQDALVYVCGCASQKNADQFSQKGVTYVCGTKDKMDIISRVAKDVLHRELARTSYYPKQTHSRAFIKIEDGCNNFCSYCVIPYLRGREVSRPICEIVREVENTSAYEVVLTGINISAYRDGQDRLPQLIKALTHVKKRIRLGSLECNIISEELLTALGGLYDFAPQFHLSLQSGSNSVLKRMNRHYTRQEYIDKCNLIYAYFPLAGITTDIIVGFCGESDEDFLDSLSIIDEVNFARIHAFAFSPREGTVAYSLKDIPHSVKAQRLDILINKAQRAQEFFIKKYLNSIQTIIAEDFDGEYTSGYTPSYIKVYVQGKLNSGTLYKVVLQELFKEGAIAKITV